MIFFCLVLPFIFFYFGYLMMLARGPPHDSRTRCTLVDWLRGVPETAPIEMSDPTSCDT